MSDRHDAPARTACAALALVLMAALAPALAAEDVLVPWGATWSYLDTGVDPGPSWTDLAFDDDGWSEGPAKLGYGNNDDVTVVGYGPDPDDKYFTTWFRHELVVADTSPYRSVTVRVKRDDGAVIYLNGNEVARSNMPSGPISAATSASGAIPFANESDAWEYDIPPWELLTGDNVIAVEVHQASASSLDLGFELELVASPDLAVVRGPYLQLLTDDRVTIRWRTFLATDSRVSYGSSPQTLDSFVDDGAMVTDHEVTLTGLPPGSAFDYAVGSSTEIHAGGDGEHRFTTAPLPGTPDPTRIWVLGDVGTANTNVIKVRDAYAEFTGSTPTDLWLLLGDNAYNDGTDAEYQAAIFDMFPETLATSCVWPCRGNHESSAATYYDLFTLPTAGEAGGVPSGTEAYYSFDYANIHFICLDSYDTSREVDDPMYAWLESDLAATDQEWLIIFWHHPPYTKGSHDSDWEVELVEMRENFVPLIEAYGVDLVLSGHSHSYERSYLIDGHVGQSWDFAPEHMVDGGDGQVDGDGPYVKTPGPNAGAVYCVAGSSGKLTDGPLDHPAMFHSVKLLGSVVIDVDDDVLDLTFLDKDAEIEDSFRLSHTFTWSNLGASLPGTAGAPQLTGTGAPVASEIVSIALTNGPPFGTSYLVLGFSTIFAPFKMGVLVPTPDLLFPGLPLDAGGNLPIAFGFPALPPGVSMIWQHWIPDPGGIAGFAASNAVSVTVP